MTTENLDLGVNLLDDLSSLHLGEKYKPHHPGPDFQEPIAQTIIIHFVKFLGLLLFTLSHPAGFWSFHCLLGLLPAGVEE